VLFVVQLSSSSTQLESPAGLFALPKRLSGAESSMQGHVLSLVFFLVLVATPTSALGLSCSTSIVLSSPAARRWRSPGRDVDGAEEAADEQPSASPSAAGSPSTSGPLISLPRLEASLAEVRTSVSMIHKELLERAAMSTPRPRAAHAAAVSSSVVAPDPLVNARSDSGVLENCMEVVLSTLGGILSGGPLGYIFGFGSAVLSKNRAPGATGPLGVMKAVHMKGWESAAYWAGISAAFAGFGTAAEVIRGK
jgi:hypothetical protein